MNARTEYEVEQEILNEIRRVTDIRDKTMHEYRRLRSQSERELYRVLLADSQLMDLQTQLILNKKGKQK